MNRGEAVTDSGERFVFGPHPDKEALARLKRECGAVLQQRGVRGIVYVGPADAAARADRGAGTSRGLRG